MNVPSRRRARLGAAGLALAALVSGCYLRPDASLTYTQLADAAHAQGDLPWFCHNDGSEASMTGHHHDGVDPYAGVPKGDLSWEDCRGTAELFDRTVNAVKAWPTKGAAEADGFKEVVPFVPGMGTHHSKDGWSQYGFDPDHPYMLQYDGEGPEARLAGVSWVAFTGDTPPEGFPGKNDWWHAHASLCAGGSNLETVDDLTDADCAAHGGTNVHLPGLWMLHGWMIPGYEDWWDVYAGLSYCVRGTGPNPNPNDLCTAHIMTGTIPKVTGPMGTAPVGTLPPGASVGSTTTVPAGGVTTTVPAGGVTTTTAMGAHNH